MPSVEDFYNKRLRKVYVEITGQDGRVRSTWWGAEPNDNIGEQAQRVIARLLEEEQDARNTGELQRRSA